MIHILLVILKIIGIVLLVILGLLLGILLAVLFIPVRYKAEGKLPRTAAAVGLCHLVLSYPGIQGCL